MESSNVLSVGDKAFAYCRKLNELKLDTQLVHVGSECFSNSALSVVAPYGFEQDLSSGIAYEVPSLRSIGDAAFSAASMLRCFVVPQHV